MWREEAALWILGRKMPDTIDIGGECSGWLLVTLGSSVGKEPAPQSHLQTEAGCRFCRFCPCWGFFSTITSSCLATVVPGGMHLCLSEEAHPCLFPFRAIMWIGVSYQLPITIYVQKESVLWKEYWNCWTTVCKSAVTRAVLLCSPHCFPILHFFFFHRTGYSVILNME